MVGQRDLDVKKSNTSNFLVAGRVVSVEQVTLLPLRGEPKNKDKKAQKKKKR